MLLYMFYMFLCFLSFSICLFYCFFILRTFCFFFLIVVWIASEFFKSYWISKMFPRQLQTSTKTWKHHKCNNKNSLKCSFHQLSKVPRQIAQSKVLDSYELWEAEQINTLILYTWSCLFLLFYCRFVSFVCDFRFFRRGFNFINISGQNVRQQSPKSQVKPNLTIR